MTSDEIHPVRPAVRRTRSGEPGVKEVASLAGVSWKTVSNVVNNRPNVRASTRDKVLAAIAELDYRPNLAGRQLRQGTSNTLVLAVPEISSPYFGRLAEEVISAAKRRGYTVLTEVFGLDPEAEKSVLAGYRDRMVDGVIYSPLTMDLSLFQTRTDTTPMVLLGERLSGAGVPHVSIDNDASARNLVSHLAARGRRRLGFIGARPGSGEGTAMLRLDGFRRGLEECGIPYEPDLVVDVQHYSREEGELAALRLLNSGADCDGVVCASDVLAVGALRAFRRRGLRVPEQMAVAGWDDIPEAAFMSPSLTSIAPDMLALADEACRLLLARIAGTDLPAEEVVIPHELKGRESTY
ncbi:LacI family DNA-binding transcriptional regulator [Paenarthrobacter sp. CCNWLY172]